MFRPKSKLREQKKDKELKSKVDKLSSELNEMKKQYKAKKETLDGKNQNELQ